MTFHYWFQDASVVNLSHCSIFVVLVICTSLFETDDAVIFSSKSHTVTGYLARPLFTLRVDFIILCETDK